MMKGYKITSSFILLIVLMLWSVISNAQHNHGNHGTAHTTHIKQPPHGGVIKEAGKYKIEMVAELFLKKDQLRFYLFKGSSYKTILNEGITGVIEIKSKDGIISTESLQAKGDDFFVAQLKSSASFQATVKLSVKGKTISAVFAHNGIEDQATTTYTCPMHPEVNSDTSGTCPKCGMNLEKQ
jgi:heavy metal-binding protein